jgi:sulfopyruvate decarboxylase subunit alpha
MVRIMEPLLNAIKVPFLCLDSEADLVRMDEAYALASAQRTAVVLLVSAPMAWR